MGQVLKMKRSPGLRPGFLTGFAFDGAAEQPWFLFGAAAAFFIATLFQVSFLQGFVQAGMGTGHSLGELVAYALFGCGYGGQESVRLPGRWLLVVGLGLIASFGWGERVDWQRQQMVVRGGSRSAWWISVFLWNLLETILYYAFFFGGAALFALVSHAEMHFSCSTALLDFIETGKIEGDPATIAATAESVSLFSFIPLFLLCAAVMGETEMLLSFIFGTWGGFVGTIIILLAPVFVTLEWLPSAYMMAARGDWYIPYGENSTRGFITALVWLAAVFICGFIITSGVDIMQGKKEM